MKNKSCDNQGAPRLRGARQRGVPLMPMLNPEDVLPADHLIRGIWLSVRGLDWTAYENGIRARGATPGRLDPRVLGTLWVWAIWQGVNSARQLAERCKTDLACLWVLAGEKTNHHTLSDFLRQDTVELDKRMAETVWALHRKAKVSFDTLLVDGTKIDARASKQSLKDLRAAVLRKLSELRSSESGENARQQAARERAKREVIEGYEAAAKMLKLRQAAVRSRGPSHEERAANMKVSLTDPEARMMRRTDGGTRSSVNVQMGIDAESGAVLYTDATDRANDYGLAVPAWRGRSRIAGGIRGSCLRTGATRICTVRRHALHWACRLWFRRGLRGIRRPGRGAWTPRCCRWRCGGRSGRKAGRQRNVCGCGWSG